MDALEQAPANVVPSDIEMPLIPGAEESVSVPVIEGETGVDSPVDAESDMPVVEGESGSEVPEAPTAQDVAEDQPVSAVEEGQKVEAVDAPDTSAVTDRADEVVVQAEGATNSVPEVQAVVEEVAPVVEPESAAATDNKQE